MDRIRYRKNLREIYNHYENISRKRTSKTHTGEMWYRNNYSKKECKLSTSKSNLCLAVRKRRKNTHNMLVIFDILLFVSHDELVDTTREHLFFRQHIFGIYSWTSTMCLKYFVLINRPSCTFVTLNHCSKIFPFSFLYFLCMRDIWIATSEAIAKENSSACSNEHVRLVKPTSTITFVRQINDKIDCPAFFF